MQGKQTTVVAEAIRSRTDTFAVGVMSGLGRRRGWLMAVAAGLVMALIAAPEGTISSSNLKVSLDTLASISGCFAATVALIRSRRIRSVSSRILGLALVILSTSMVLFVTVPALLDSTPGMSIRVARTLSNLACASLLAWIAVAPPARHARCTWQRDS